MHDLRDKLLQAGVPEPNRAEKRRSAALEKLGQRPYTEDDAQPGVARLSDEAVRFLQDCPPDPEAEEKPEVRRLPGGVRHVRCGPPRKS